MQRVGRRALQIGCHFPSIAFVSDFLLFQHAHHCTSNVSSGDCTLSQNLPSNGSSLIASQSHNGVLPPP